MQTLTRQQVDELLKNKPSGTSDSQIIKSLTQKGYEIEGLSLPSQKKKEPNALNRVGDVINRTGEDVAAQIQGTGEFSEQSAIRRGTGVVSSAFGAVPGAAVAASPEPVRQGIEKAADIFTKGFDWVADKIGSVPALQKFVMDNPAAAKAIEEIAGTASNVGGISDVILGAKGLERGITRTGEATFDVGREALDRTLRATDNLAQKATPASIRTMFKGNTPESKTAAVTQLEDAYKTGLVQDRKAINNKLDNLAAENSLGGEKITRDILIKELAQEGYIPKIEGQFAKFDEVFDDIDTRQQVLMEQIDVELAPLQGTEFQTSLDRIRAEAEAALRRSPQVGANLDASIKQLDRFIESFRNKYGDSVTPAQINEIRKNMNAETKAYKEAKEGKFKLDSADAVARSTRSRLDELVPSGKVRENNAEWARLNRVEQTARVLNNEIVEVGLIGRKLGSYVGTIGASLAGLSLAGPGGLVVASIFAQLGSDALATILRAKKFSPELREAIINNIKADAPTAQRLIREASPENKTFLRNLLMGVGTAAAVEYFADDGTGVAVGAAGSTRKLNPRGKKVVDDYLSHVDGTKKLKGEELARVREEAQAIGEGIGVNTLGSDKKLADQLADYFTSARRQ